MEKIVKVTNENYPELYEDKLEKYILMDTEENNTIIGTAIIDDKVKTNKISVNILEKYRSNGYGKLMFQELLKEYKMNYIDSELRFEVNEQNEFNNILHKLGSVHIANKNGTLVHILPLKRR